MSDQEEHRGLCIRIVESVSHELHQAIEAVFVVNNLFWFGRSWLILLWCIYSMVRFPIIYVWLLLWVSVSANITSDNVNFRLIFLRQSWLTALGEIINWEHENWFTCVIDISHSLGFNDWLKIVLDPVKVELINNYWNEFLQTLTKHIWSDASQ